MNLRFPPLLLAFLFPALLVAGDWAAPLATGPDPEPAAGPGWFGAPNLKFGRSAVDAGLPGSPVATVSYLHQFESDFDSLAGEVDSFDLSLWAPVAPLNFGDFHVIAMLGYRLTEFDNSATTLLPDDTLHSLRLPVVFLLDHSEEWIYGGMVMPSYVGDLTSSDNFSLAAALGAGRSFGPDLRVFGGVYYSHGFGEDTVIPGIGFTWRPSPRWQAYLLGPVGGVTYTINDDWLLSLTGQYDAPTWHVEADGSGNPDRDVEVSALRLGLKLERRLTSHLWASLTGGVSLARELDIEDTADTELLEDDIDPGPFLQFGLNLRY